MIDDYIKDGRITRRPGAIDGAGHLPRPVPDRPQRRHLRAAARHRQARSRRDFRDMTPNREKQWCCGGGGGIVAMEEFNDVRLKSRRQEGRADPRDGRDDRRVPVRELPPPDGGAQRDPRPRPAHRAGHGPRRRGHAAQGSQARRGSRYPPSRPGHTANEGPLRDARSGPCSVRVTYQMCARVSAGRTIGEPSTNPNASANAGMLPSGPLTRKRAGECGSTLTMSRRYSGV